MCICDLLIDQSSHIPDWRALRLQLLGPCFISVINNIYVKLFSVLIRSWLNIMRYLNVTDVMNPFVSSMSSVSYILAISMTSK